MNLRHPFLAALALCAFALPASAVVTPFQSAPTNPDTTRNDAFAQAGWGFYATTGTKQVNQLGYWVPPNTTTTVPHVVTLYDYLGTDGANYAAIAQVSIPVGSVGDANGYAWVSIPTVTLTDVRGGADYYIVMASFNTDIWAPFTGSAHTTVVDSSFGTVTGFGFASNTPAPAVGGQAYFTDTGTNGGFFGGNIGFEVPEPSSIAIIGLGGIALVRRRHCR